MSMPTQPQVRATEERFLEASKKYNIAITEVTTLMMQTKVRDANPLTAGPFLREMQAAYVRLSEAAEEMAICMAEMVKFCDAAVAHYGGQQPELP